MIALRLAQALLGAALGVIALLAAGVPLPRLIATGCSSYATGVALAVHEDELRGSCHTVTNLRG